VVRIVTLEVPTVQALSLKNAPAPELLPRFTVVLLVGLVGVLLAFWV
jgi:hypothetical protein